MGYEQRACLLDMASAYQKEWREPKQKKHPVVDVIGDRSKV